MSEPTKHTPGPWAITDDADWLLGAVVGVMDKDSEDGAVAYAYKICGNRTQEESQANARLIAAAPEMLNALKLARDALFETCYFQQSDMDAIDTAIRKAESGD